jgi:hypothetical protein
MTLELRTKSHGNVEAGFYAAFTKLSRIGKYAFETRNLCELARTLAENPKIKKLQICGYNINKFWQLSDEYEGVLKEKCIDSVVNDKEEELDDFLAENRDLSIEDKAKSVDNLRILPVKIDYKKKTIKIGEYEIEKTHFIIFMHYLLHGGFCGWLEGDKPDFVDDIMILINTSNNPLLRNDTL